MGGPAWLLDIFAPLLGTVICNVMWLSPLPGILEARRQRDLGALNPIPYAVTICNCVGWLIYGCMRRDYFIFFGNFLGLVLGIFYSVSSLVLLSRKRSDQTRSQVLTALLLFTPVFWGLMAMIACIVFGSSPAAQEQGAVFIGLIGMGFGLAYYVSPLSSMWQTIKTRDSSSLSMPLIITSLVNAAMWMIYGFWGKGDLAIWLPNAVGLCLTTLQFGVKLWLPGRSGGGSGGGVGDDKISHIKIETNSVVQLNDDDFDLDEDLVVESPLHTPIRPIEEKEISKPDTPGLQENAAPLGIINDVL